LKNYKINKLFFFVFLEHKYLANKYCFQIKKYSRKNLKEEGMRILRLVTNRRNRLAASGIAAAAALGGGPSSSSVNTAGRLGRGSGGSSSKITPPDKLQQGGSDKSDEFARLSVGNLIIHLVEK
jgi:hypothetical protein